MKYITGNTDHGLLIMNVNRKHGKYENYSVEETLTMRENTFRTLNRLVCDTL